MDSSRINFNVYKHHLDSIRTLVMEADFETLTNTLKRIGNSTLDLYTGDLSVDSIKKEVADLLSSRSIIDVKSYSKYLKENAGFQNIGLSDGSTWTLRKIRGPEFIHIHPARYSQHSVRTNGSSLKTVIATKSLFDSYAPGIQDINESRERIGLPPVKKVVRNRGISKLFKLF